MSQKSLHNHYPIVPPTSNFKLMEENGPQIMARGKGVYQWDDKGKQYLEGMAGLWCTSLGYGNGEIAETAAEAMRTMGFAHMFSGKSHEAGIRLAEKLEQMLPMDDSRIFFGVSGSDANDTQVKLMRYYFNAIGRPDKKKIISRHLAYHGVTLASGSLTGIPVNHALFDLPLDGFLHTDSPFYFRDAMDEETEEDFTNRILENLDELIQREGPDTIAAFIAEPIMGAGGVILPPEGYFPKLRALLDKYDIFLIDDEVICGFGRTGNAFGCETFDFRPDTMSMAKALTSAYMPLSAVAIPESMYQAMIDATAEHGVFGHGFTYSGHPVSCAVALKVLEIYERDNVFAYAAKMGSYLQQKLQHFSDHPLVGEVRGTGMIAGLHLAKDKETKSFFDPAGTAGAKVIAACVDNGLILRNLGDVIAICPPLVISEAEIDELVDKLGKSLDGALEDLKRQGSL
ncbi:aminotransferase [Emcibacter nanhaiensis]|uniref:Aminotransferase class III-fold pyridoxal phosphate-dependent enzyme n=1 Tax=Emcibacter nanhaiensis TaxID=1505037 RepID=A0A501PQ83_9PROT|nr:aminotransferase [Emcibacter nanhaiensis]TPD62690.1 aminotransferase class III-fold pyridoxal phosphate-dependent enzyme [Emcibacter nanhaiensis]